MGVGHEESMATDLTRIRTVLDSVSAGSGITVEAAIDVGAQVGILNVSSVWINPSTEESLNQVRLNTARIFQPSGQQLMANSLSVAVASDQKLTFSLTPSGQQPSANSMSVVLASDQKIVPISVTISGQQVMASSLSVTMASDQSRIPVMQPSGQQTMASSSPVVIASNQTTFPVTATIQTSGQQPMAASVPVTLASNQNILPVSVTVSGQQTMANSSSVMVASDQTNIRVAVTSGVPADLARTQSMTSGLISTTYRTVTNSNIRATAVTALAGSRLQVFEIQAVNYSSAPVWLEVYYGTGSDITVNASGYLLNTYLTNTTIFPGKVWEQGSKISSASDVISVRTSGIWPNQPDITSSGLVNITYRQI